MSRNYYRKRNGGQNSSQNRGRSRRNNSRNYRGRSNGSNKFSENIPHEKYIAVAEEGFEPPSIYVEKHNFDEFDLGAKLKQNIQKKGYVHPTKIQFEAIPQILQGKDVLGLASTGSGKTAAFLAPMIEKIRRNPKERVMIIVPTRELASQLTDEIRDLARDMHIYSTLIIGGLSIGAQIQQLRRDPHFVIATPGRLKDHFDRKTIDLRKFNNIILDEVDRMLDMGFVNEIKFIVSKLRQDKQTLFFSATMSNKVEEVANTLLHNPVRIQIEKESPLKSVDQNIVRISGNDDKVEILHSMLIKDEFEKVLVFSRTKYGADKLSRHLEKRGVRVESIHGNKSQNKRLRVITMFKTDEISVLIATDVAARGLDVPDVTHVINFDEPQTYKDYIHRIGRTGRAGKPGKALTFVQVG